MRIRETKGMAKKLVKKTAEYSIYQRGDARYSIKGANNKKPINGDEKTRILQAEELVKVLKSKPAAEAPAADEAAAE